MIELVEKGEIMRCLEVVFMDEVTYHLQATDATATSPSSISEDMTS